MRKAAAGDALFLLTWGAGEASVLLRGKRIGRLAPPRLPAVANPIGAGDTRANWSRAGLTSLGPKYQPIPSR